MEKVGVGEGKRKREKGMQREKGVFQEPLFGDSLSGGVLGLAET